MGNCDHQQPPATTSKVLLVSYSTGMPGFSPSEWIQDKLEAARELGQFVILVTSASSLLESCSHQKVVKLSSISRSDFEQERLQSEETGAKLPFGSSILPTLIGRLFDTLFKFFAGSRSDGRWSWTLSAVPAILVAYARHRPGAFVASGGPSSAQFAASIASFAPWVGAPVLEFQDPFIGLEMNLSPRTMRAMAAIDNFMLRRAKKYVAVSKGSLERLRGKAQIGVEKLEAVYPFAHPKLPESESGDRGEVGSVIEFLHAGTLYGTRSLQPLFSVLDDAYTQGTIARGSVVVTNLGADYTDSPDRFDYRKFGAVSRTSAVSRALQATCLLLVQHSDSRSLETIPFKLYDYLNLSIPILVIGRNGEIKELLSEGDFFTEIGNERQLASAVIALAGNRTDSSQNVLKRPASDAYVSAWLKVLS